MWQCRCDKCDKQFEMFQDVIALNDKNAVQDHLLESDWSMLTNDKTYCPECHTKKWNEEGDILSAYSIATSERVAKYLGEVIC